MAPPNNLIKDDGTPFSTEELQAASKELDGLSNAERRAFSDQNSLAIASHTGARMLIVSGPGTGKTYLFLERIRSWLGMYKDQTIVVTTFVRKLVSDLTADVERKLGNDDRQRITVWTLHKFARSIAEKNHGNSQWTFRPYFKIIAPQWKLVVWEDVLRFHPELGPDSYSWRAFEKQSHEDAHTDDPSWNSIRETYRDLSRFFNAANFCDLILLARAALEENGGLNSDTLFVIDEYQDFNQAEENLLRQLTKTAKGILVVGDDDQVLYETLKSGSPDLIRGLYRDASFVNAMLPFCRRSDFHITRTACSFVAQLRDGSAIEKIYLPIAKEPVNAPVQILGCASRATVIDYIRKFIETYQNEIDQRKRDLEAGKEKDPFLLILSPSREARFLGPERFDLTAILDQYKRKSSGFSEDYFRVLNYYSLAKSPQNNFAFRKVLYFEDVESPKVHEFLGKALSEQKDLVDLKLEGLDGIYHKCLKVREIIDSDLDAEQKVKELQNLGIQVQDSAQFAQDLTAHKNANADLSQLESQEDEQAEAVEKETQQMSVIELLTIVSSKGLSADHVIILGFDNVNMKHITKNAFFVALTRARKTLHILTSLKTGGASAPHSFTGALPQAHVSYGWYKKTDRTTKSFKNASEFLKYYEFMRKTTAKKKES